MDKYLMLSDGKSPHTVKWIKELVNYFDVYLVSFNGYNKEILEYITADKVYILKKSSDSKGGNFNILFYLLKLKRITNKIDFKYINSHYLTSYGLMGALIKKDNNILIQSTWGTDILVTPWKNFIYKVLAEYSLKKSNFITSDSYFMADKIKEIYTHNNIVVFPFGLECFEMNENIEKDEYLIFSNRALSKNYNVDKIIEWFSSLKNKKYKLVIANDGEMKANLEKLVFKLNLENRIKFVGFLTREEQEKFYRLAKYYISIPSSDSTAVSLLEAMRFGCIPIVSNLPANREWILHGINGYYFEEFFYEINDENNLDIIKINQKLIFEKAIFLNSIKNYIIKLRSWC